MPEQYTDTLSNGLTLIGEKIEGVRSLALGFVVGAGSVNDPDDKVGLGHFVESMLLEGTQTRTSRQISESLDALGVRYGTSLDGETLGLSGVMVGSRLEPAFEILADILLHPSFPEQETEQTRASILQELRNEEDQPMTQVRNVLRRVYYEGHPYSKKPNGEPEVIKRISREELAAFHKEHFYPANAICAIAGDFNWDKFRSLAEQTLGNWSGTGPTLEIPPHQPKPQVYVEAKESQQEHIAGASPCVPFGHTDYYAAIIAGDVFGGGMSSRLFDQVREKRGLAYQVGASFSPGRHQGSWRVYVGTTPEKASQSYNVLLEEMEKMDAHGITEEEFNRFQGMARSHILMSGESTSARLRSLVSSWWYERRLKSLDYVRDRIDSVTMDQVNRTLKDWPLRRDLVLCALGPSTRESLVNGK